MQTLSTLLRVFPFTKKRKNADFAIRFAQFGPGLVISVFLRKNRAFPDCLRYKKHHATSNSRRERRGAEHAPVNREVRHNGNERWGGRSLIPVAHAPRLDQHGGFLPGTTAKPTRGFVLRDHIPAPVVLSGTTQPPCGFLWDHIPPHCQ